MFSVNRNGFAPHTAHASGCDAGSPGCKIVNRMAPARIGPLLRPHAGQRWSASTARSIFCKRSFVPIASLQNGLQTRQALFNVGGDASPDRSVQKLRQGQAIAVHGLLHEPFNSRANVGGSNPSHKRRSDLLNALRVRVALREFVARQKSALGVLAVTNGV
jgi:hypothetical protein